jgi:hypothetical protein
MAAPRTPVRRRQRGVRASVVLGLLSGATVVVLVLLPTQSPLWLSLAAVTALALSWVSVRIMWTEVLQSRRENLAERGAAEDAYLHLIGVRAAEHAGVTTAMTERLAESHLAQRELEGLVTLHETRAGRAESQLAAAQARVQSLEQTLALLHPERPSTHAVEELVAWDEATQRNVRSARERPAL